MMAVTMTELNGGMKDPEPSLYDTLTAFVGMMRDRMERENARALSLADQAESAKRQANETQRVYETVAKLHEAMANTPADAPPTVRQGPFSPSFATRLP